MQKKISFNFFTLKHAIWVLLFFAAFVEANEKENPAENNQDIESYKFYFDRTYSIVGLVLPHNSLRSSKTLHNWPFFAVAVPAWNFATKLEKNFKLVTLKNNNALDAGFTGLGVKLEAALELIHLLEFAVQANGGTALNYGETATMMGVYKPLDKDYRQDIIFTEYAYGLRYKGTLTIPLLAFLPKSNWTKIILKGNAELAYAGYTGASDGEVWKVGSENLVNGYKYKFSSTLIYMLPFTTVPIVMVSAGYGGFLHPSDFDEIYKDYNPGFKNVNVTPMAMIKISENWNGTLMTVFGKKRIFENTRYESTEELLQKQTGSRFELQTILFVASKKF